MICKRYIKKLYGYYYIKWNKINVVRKDNFSISIFLKIAYFDLKNLLEIEQKLNDNQNYKDIFWGKYSGSLERKSLFDSFEQSNLCISQIVDLIIGEIEDINILDKLESIKPIMELLDILNDISNNIKLAYYFSGVFEKMYSHVIYDRGREVFVVKEFSRKVKEKCVAQFLHDKVKEESKKILMSGNQFSSDKIEYLIEFLSLRELISILIFRLTYSERSHRETMSIEEFRVWKKTIDDRLEQNQGIQKLKQNNYIEELCIEIESTKIGHFMTSVFLEWIWNSLFERFDDKIYYEFNDWGQKGLRTSFSIDTYMIIRMLLCEDNLKKLNYPIFRMKLEKNSKPKYFRLGLFWKKRECIYLMNDVINTLTKGN